MAALAYEFKWAHDFWKRMGWVELRQWLRELNKIREARAGLRKTDPDSWAGEESDVWWAEQRAKRERERGR